MGPKEQAVRATLPGRPAAILYEDSELRRKINHCFAGLFNGAFQGHVLPNGSLYVGKAECEWDWQQVWPALKELGLVDYAIEEVTHQNGYVSKEFRWSVTDKGRKVRDDDNAYFSDLMDAIFADREATGPTLADELRAEQEALRRRMIHHTRPEEPLDLEQAIALSAWMGKDA